MCCPVLNLTHDVTAACWKHPRLFYWSTTLRGGCFSSGATRLILLLLLCFIKSKPSVLCFFGISVVIYFTVCLCVDSNLWLKMMDVEQRPQDAGDELEEETESTESLVCTVLAALQKLDAHLQESGDVSLSSYPRRPHVSRFFSTVKHVSFQVLPGTVLDEVQHLCVPPEVIHQLLERDMLLSAQEHLELYDSPIVIDLDAGERPEGSLSSSAKTLEVIIRDKITDFVFV